MKLNLTVENQSVFPLIDDVTMKSSDSETVGSMRFTLPFVENALENGQQATLFCDGETLFSGRIFSITRQDKQTTALCYDQKRYLLFKDSRAFAQGFLFERVEGLLKEKSLSFLPFAGSDVRLPGAVYDGKSGLYMIEDAIREAKLLGKSFALLSEKGKLILREKGTRVLKQEITPDNILSYLLYRDIDRETFNRVQLTRKQSKSGRRDYFIAEDAASVQKWGALCYYEPALQKDADLYLKEKAERLLAEKNRERTGLYIKCVGVPLLAAGDCLFIDGGQAFARRLYTLREVSHRFLGGCCETELTADEVLPK